LRFRTASKPHSNYWQMRLGQFRTGAFYRLYWGFAIAELRIDRAWTRTENTEAGDLRVNIDQRQRRKSLYVEALAAAAFVFYVGITKAKDLI
jgi:hypothetical protein